MFIRKIVLPFLIYILWQTTSYAAPTAILKHYTITDTPSASLLTIRTTAHPSYRISRTKDSKQLILDFKNSKDIPKALAPTGHKRIKTVHFLPQAGGKMRMAITLAPSTEFTSDVVIAPDAVRPFFLLRLTVSDANAAHPKPTAKAPATPPVFKPLIVIDAGHGGQDPGSKGDSGKYEKWITLEYAKALQDVLMKTGKYRTYLTREDDTLIDLHERVKRSEAEKGDLFISIHADSHNDKNMHGLSVYTLSETASDKEAEGLALQANTSGTIGNTKVTTPSQEVTPLLIEMVQRDTKNLSASFAETLVTQLQQQIILLRNTHRFAGFRVLTSASIPSVLIELGYLSNPEEESLLQSTSYKKKLVSSIAKAIDIYCQKYAHRS